MTRWLSIRDVTSGRYQDNRYAKIIKMSETLTSTASTRNDTMASRRSSTTMSTSIISMQLDVDTMQVCVLCFVMHCCYIYIDSIGVSNCHEKH